MRWRISFFLGLLFLSGSAGAFAQSLADLPLEARVTDQMKVKDRDKGSGGSLLDFENSYTAELRNTSPGETLDGIKLCLITFRVGHDAKRQDTGHSAGLVEIRENISLVPNESKRIEFGTESFRYGEIKKVTSMGKDRRALVEVSYFGSEYAGAVLEIYLKGKLVGVRIDGDGALKKAYEAWAANRGARSQSPGFPPNR